MDKNELMDRIFKMPTAIFNAEMALFNSQSELAKAKEALAAKEADLYTEGKIDGKNAEIRNAQMRQLTTPERNEIAKAENSLNLARIALSRQQNEFTAYKAIAGMLKGAE